jgi:hypothetical protein
LILRRNFISSSDKTKDLLMEAAKKHPRHCELVPELQKLKEEMVRFVPYEGPLDRFITVLLGAGTKQGDSVGPHAHKGWTAVYYPFGAENIIIEGKDYKPEVDEIIVLPPGTEHEVPYTDVIRLSVAVVVATPDGAG